MSEIRPIRGPEPGPGNSSYHGLVRTPEGDVGAEFRHSKTGEISYLSETGVYKSMVKETANSLLFDPQFNAQLKRDAEISHFALAEIQADKMSRGIKLDTEFKPHPDVHVPNPDDTPQPTPEN